MEQPLASSGLYTYNTFCFCIWPWPFTHDINLHARPSWGQGRPQKCPSWSKVWSFPVWGICPSVCNQGAYADNLADAVYRLLIFFSVYQYMNMRQLTMLVVECCMGFLYPRPGGFYNYPLRRKRRRFFTCGFLPAEVIHLIILHLLLRLYLNKKFVLKDTNPWITHLLTYWHYGLVMTITNKATYKWSTQKTYKSLNFLLQKKDKGNFDHHNQWINIQGQIPKLYFVGPGACLPTIISTDNISRIRTIQP